MASSASLKILLISITLISVTLFFLVSPPHYHHLNRRRRLLLQSSSNCSSSSSSSGGIVNYSSLHFCLLSGSLALSLPVLSLFLLLHFYSLVRTAGDHFTPVVTRLSSRLRLSPSMAAVTLLALGNGAPDVFSSSAALRHGHSRTGLAAILSAGAFVSAFVVGSVALISAPIPLDPAPFVRDVFSYLLAASSLFYIYLSAEIYLWQAVGLIAFYVFFVALVFYMDLGGGGGTRAGDAEKEVEMGLVEKETGLGVKPASADRKAAEDEAARSRQSFFWILFGKISKLWEVPVMVILKLTIPSISPSEWNRFYAASNICLCPLALLYSFNSVIPMDGQVVFFLPQHRFPLWSVVFFVSLCLAITHFFLEKEPPPAEEAEWTATTVVAFAMSVFWISTMAGELLNCLAAVGAILDLPPAILGLTVLAWGNSVGDLVADVTLAKAGQPAMALAGCFAGPMFNMLVGLGSALVVETAEVYPGAYELQFHVSIVMAFVFLLLSLMGSLLVVTWYRFRVPRFWGFCLVALYLVFTAVSLAIARFAA